MTTAQLLASTDPEVYPTVNGSGEASRYSLFVAQDPEDIAAAQRLRFDVFAGEMGAKLQCPTPGLDADRFDEFCDHIVVREDRTGQIVGTYRMLPPERAAAAGGLYAETEFDLAALDGLRPSLVETGRSCVHPAHRSGAVVGLVWTGIARYMMLSGHRYLAGCATVPVSDGGGYAAGVWRVFRERYYTPESMRVRPLRPWQYDGEEPSRALLPPLLRGYLRLGAMVCGPPAYDPAFQAADFLVLLDLHQVDQRYLKFFLGI